MKPIVVCIKCDKEIPDTAQVCPYCGADNSEIAPNPCFQCPERTQICHDDCRRYNIWSWRRNNMLNRRGNEKYQNYIQNINKKKKKRR